MGAQLEKLTTVEYQVNDKNNLILPHIATELVKNGNLAGLKNLLHRGEKIVFKDGTTLLHLAAFHHQADCLRYLIDKQIVPINSEDMSCETALNSSLMLTPPESFLCSDMLISAGAQLNLKNKWLRTPLLKSVIDQNEDVVLYLLDKGANPNTEDCMGCTPLNQSAYYHMHRSFNRLLQKSADIDHVNLNGQTALNFACKSLNKTSITKLINCGTCVNITSLKKVMMFFTNALVPHPEKKPKMEAILQMLISALCEMIPLDTFLKTSFLQTDFNISHRFLAVTDTRNMFQYKMKNLKMYFKDEPDLLQNCDQVQPLKKLCRMTVRGCVVLNGGNVVSNINQLIIPPGLKSVILLQDIKL